jgi:beta-lactamase regulating signal transducer with metallopeptidase domain
MTMAIILAVLAWLLTYLLHSTALLAGAFLLAGLGIVRSHAGRDTLWKVAIVGGVLTATAQLALRLQPPAGHVALAARPQSPLVDVAGVRDVTPPASTEPAAEPVAERFASDVSDAPAPLPAAPVAPARPRHQTRTLFSGLHVSWPALLLNLWFVGALGFGLRLGWLRWSLGRELRARAPLVEGPLPAMLADLCRAAGVRSPRLSVSRDIAGPIAFGQEICLPERVLTQLAPSEQRAVLAHELGHVLRRDPAWLMATAAIQSVLFIQPLNRYARRRLRDEAEYLCDDWAAERAGGVELARCLAEVAGWVQGHPAPAAVAGMAGHGSQLVSRVERLLDGSRRVRPSWWLLRAGAGVAALTLVACSIPGVAAEDVGTSADAVVVSADDAAYVPAIDEGWGVVRDGGRLIELLGGYSVRITGHGHLAFRQWNRGIVIPEGYEIRQNGRAIADDSELCSSQGTVRLVEIDGDGSWELTAIRRADQPAWAAHDADRVGANVAAAVSQVAHAEADASTDAALNGEADAAIDTLVQLWVRDPESVRRAARRIARNYDRDLRPRFESLGIEVGRELAPQLERLTSRVGRDLTPEFARFGAALGASILADLAATVEPDAGSGDFHGKKPPKDD